MTAAGHAVRDVAPQPPRIGDQRELDFITPPNVLLPAPQKAALAPLPLFDLLSDKKNEAAN